MRQVASRSAGDHGSVQADLLKIIGKNDQRRRLASRDKSNPNPPSLSEQTGSKAEISSAFDLGMSLISALVTFR